MVGKKKGVKEARIRVGCLFSKRLAQTTVSGGEGANFTINAGVQAPITYIHTYEILQSKTPGHQQPTLLVNADVHTAVSSKMPQSVM